MLKHHEIEVRVRYAETDAMGLLHHANYFVYFEMGRTEMLRASGGTYREMEQAGIFIVVVEADCRYHRPARYVHARSRSSNSNSATMSAARL